MGALRSSARGVVVGATDPDATVAFLGAFGLTVRGSREVPADEAAALYGLDAATTEVTLGTSGAVRPEVWVVRCEVPGAVPTDFERRPRALDIYTSSMDDALDHLSFVGLAAGPVGTLAVGPVTMRQCLVAGPDGVAVVLVESTHRRGSLLDDGPDDGPDGAARERLFSEGHSVVWCVDSMDDEAALLASAGLARGTDLAFEEPEVSTYLDLPRSPVPIRMTMLSGAEVEPLRLEMLEFTDDPGVVDRSDVLAGGLWAMRFDVGDPGSAAGELETLGCTRRVHGGNAGARAVTTPGGIRLQLVEFAPRPAT